jgi:hypothetical protein
VSWVILKRRASVNLNDHFFAFVSVIHGNTVAVFLSYFERSLFFRVEFTGRPLSDVVSKTNEPSGKSLLNLVRLALLVSSVFFCKSTACFINLSWVLSIFAAHVV